MKKISVLIFLDELYFKKGQKYFSKYNAGRFLCNLDKKFALKYTFPTDVTIQTNIASVIEEKDAIPLPNWNSLVNYIIQYNTLSKSIVNILQDKIKEFDIVWLRMPSLAGILIAKLAFKLKKPVIIHFAGDIRIAYSANKFNQIQKIVGYFIGNIIHYFQKEMIKKNNNNVYTLCTGSVLQKEFQFNNSKFFIDSETDNIKSINIISEPLFKKCLYVGRLIPSKGVLFLINTILMTSDLTLSIVGHGELENKIKEYEKKNNRITYYGFKTGKELQDIYISSHCLIMPTINYPEGFPRVIAEAWSHGLAVISSNVGGIEGIGKHEENLMFFEPGNCHSLSFVINELKNNKLLFQKIRQNGLKTAIQLSKSSMLSLVENTICQALKK